MQRLNDEPTLVRPAPLQQRALHILFVRRLGDVDRLHRARVDAGVVHAGADRAGRGVEILHLLGLAAAAVEILRERHGVRERAAGVRAHEVRHDVLFLIILVVELAVFVHEALVRADVGLAHVVEHGVDAVLGRDLELTGDVIAHELAEERVVVVAEHIVVADAAAHEHLLHAGDLAQLAQQGEIVRVVGVDVRARRRRKAQPVRAHAALFLLPARRVAEIRRRTADVGHVALPEWVVRHGLDLADDARVAAARDHAPLMERQRTEIAPAEAAAVVDHAEAHLLDRGYAAERLVHRVPLAGVGQVGHAVELLGVERHGGRGDDEIAPLARLDHGAAAHGVVLGVFGARGLGIEALVVAHVLERRERDVVKFAHGGVTRDVARAGDVGHRVHGLLFLEPVSDLDRRGLAHAVDQQVGRGVKEDGAAHGIVPVVIVRKATQARLERAENDRHIGAEGLARAVAVDDSGAVGAAAGALAGGVKILAAAALGRRVVRDHGVEIARADEHAQPRPAHGAEGLRIVPVRLCEHGYTQPLGLEHAADDRRAEARMVDIGVAADDERIVPPPAALVHLLGGDGQKITPLHVSPSCG